MSYCFLFNIKSSKHLICSSDKKIQQKSYPLLLPGLRYCRRVVLKHYLLGRKCVHFFLKIRRYRWSVWRVGVVLKITRIMFHLECDPCKCQCPAYSKEHGTFWYDELDCIICIHVIVILRRRAPTCHKLKEICCESYKL